MTTKLERLDHSVSHEWHVAVNACATERGHDDWPKFMYEAKTAADEVPRMALLFRLEREAKLRQTHQHCSHCEPEPVKDNHLTCCLGTKCRECPFLLALETAKLTPEQIDQAKAWTCAAHIISKGGDMMGEGYLLTECIGTASTQVSPPLTAWWKATKRRGTIKLCNRGSANEHRKHQRRHRDRRLRTSGWVCARATNDTDPPRGDQAIYTSGHRSVGTNRQSHKVE